MKDKIIKIDNLVFEYVREENEKLIRAVDGVSLEIEKGSFTAIIGQNGSGKSTLAKNINALLLPTKGAVYVKGMNTADDEYIWEIRQTAGMVFQNPDNQLVSAIVEDDVAFGPENMGIESEEIRTRVDEALKAVDMTEFSKKAPHMLSGGQKQRIAIAGVIAMRPECVIFDEPTAMLDPRGRGEVMKIIRELNREGITVVLITHFMEEAAMAQRIVVMNNGHVEMDGKPCEIFKQNEKLEKLNMDVPVAIELAQRLRNRGIEIPDEIINAEELIEYVCRYR